MWLTKEGIEKMKEEYDRWGPKTREFIDWFLDDFIAKQGGQDIHMTLHLELFRDRKIIKDLFGLDVEEDLGKPPKYKTVEEAFEDIFGEMLEMERSLSEPMDWNDLKRQPCENMNHLICQLVNSPDAETDPSAQGKTPEEYERLKKKFGL